MRARAGFACLLLVAGASCGERRSPPEAQFVIHVTTDAPLPVAYGKSGSGGHVPLFDRLVFEVFPGGTSTPCDECMREFEVDESMIDEGRASIGVIPSQGAAGVRVRVRLFRGNIDAQAPRRASTIERVVQLPSSPAEGVRHLTVMLHTEDVGRPAGTLDAPVSADAGEPGKGIVGSWPDSNRVECEGQSGADNVCIPGGPFWMGDPRIDLAGAGNYQGNNERLVVVSPFLLDKTEVTVAAFRASGLAERDSYGHLLQPVPATTGTHCTYTEQPGASEDMPVNCLTWRLADAYCKQHGKRLPTEAELAYASSGLGQSIFVWGQEPPSCDDAVFGRDLSTSPCASRGLGPSAVGSAKRDALVLATGTVFDLAGNVMEFAADFWQLDSEPCWAGAGVLRNPNCDLASELDLIGKSVRGGDFSSRPTFLRAALRTRIQGESKATSELVGFRCARDR